MSETIETARTAPATREVQVWDILVRAGHWALVVLFIVAWLTEGELLGLHSWAGYGIGAYLAVRVIWGFIGTRHARFADFAYGPRAALAYLLDLVRFRSKRYLGHSPAGAMMVYALLVALTLTVISGVALLAVEENRGPLAPWLGAGAPAAAVASEDEEREESGGGRREESALEEVHEVFANLSLILVFAHIGGVVLASVAHRENLARSMVTGRKRAE